MRSCLVRRRSLVTAPVEIFCHSVRGDAGGRPQVTVGVAKGMPLPIVQGVEIILIVVNLGNSGALN